MLLQDAPAALDRVVLAVVGRVVGQAHRQAGVARRTGRGGATNWVRWLWFSGPLSRLSTSVVTVGEAVAHRLPPLRQPVDQAVAGHPRGHRRRGTARPARAGGARPASPSPPAGSRGRRPRPARGSRPWRENGPILTVALASSETRSVSGAASAARLTAVTCGEDGVGRGDLFWGLRLGHGLGVVPQRVAASPRSSARRATPRRCSPAGRSAGGAPRAAVSRVYRRVVRKEGSAWLWPSTMAARSASRLGRCASARLRPRSAKASTQANPLRQLALPLADRHPAPAQFPLRAPLPAGAEFLAPCAPGSAAARCP